MSHMSVTGLIPFGHTSNPLRKLLNWGKLRGSWQPPALSCLLATAAYQVPGLSSQPITCDQTRAPALLIPLKLWNWPGRAQPGRQWPHVFTINPSKQDKDEYLRVWPSRVQPGRLRTHVYTVNPTGKTNVTGTHKKRVTDSEASKTSLAGKKCNQDEIYII